MPLHGTLDMVTFSDVVALVARRRLGGRLRVHAGDAVVSLYFEDGQVVGCSAPGRPESRAGDARMRATESCAKVLTADRGSFEFHRDIAFAGTDHLRLEARTLLRDARRRLDAWQEIASAIPSLDVRPQPSDDLAQTEVTLTADQWRILRALDGRRTIRIVARTLGRGEFEVSQVVKALLDAGLVRLEPATAIARAELRSPDDRAPQPLTEPDGDAARPRRRRRPLLAHRRATDETAPRRRDGASAELVPAGSADADADVMLLTAPARATGPLDVHEQLAHVQPVADSAG